MHFMHCSSARILNLLQAPPRSPISLPYSDLHLPTKDSPDSPRLKRREGSPRRTRTSQRCAHLPGSTGFKKALHLCTLDGLGPSQGKSRISACCRKWAVIGREQKVDSGVSWGCLWLKLWDLVICSGMGLRMWSSTGGYQRRLTLL